MTALGWAALVALGTVLMVWWCTRDEP